MDSEYKIERLDFSNPKDMQRLVDLQNAVYAGKHVFTNKSFQYWYLDNPNGKVVSYNALYQDIIAAHYALIPLKMEINGRVALGLLSMATVTHPNHQGKGLFKTLAKTTYEYAAQEGYEFVIGVANANSYPGFIKYFPFQDVGPLEVLFGFSNKITQKGDKVYRVYWDDEGIKWRANRFDYSKDRYNLFGSKGFWKFKKAPLMKTFMGVVDEKQLELLSIDKVNILLRPLNLYIGLGSNAKDLGYHPLPGFIKRSPFRLIFMDISGAKLPTMTKENVFFQLMDFDVA
jgi:GNAT superfamily N-acetyltransferase